MSTTTPEADEHLAAAATPIGFIEGVLGLSLYRWQDNALAPLADLIDDNGKPKRQQISVVAPNGSGKSERIVAGAILYWLATYPKAKVVFTTRDSKQLANQVWPALLNHRAKFPASWKWVTSPNHTITTDTGGSALLFTTNDEGRAEGFHMDFDPLAGKFDGPLLMILDEAKSVPDAIFSATDRCTFNVRLLVSSPGNKSGRFYKSHRENRGEYICVQAGLADCPHIPQSKIDSIIAENGIDHPVTRSSLFGEFMDSTMRGRFSREGIKHVRAMAATHNRQRQFARLDPQPDKNVSLQPCAASDPSAWLLIWEEEPIPGCRYLISVDTASFKEQQNSENDARDCHAVLVLRDAYTDRNGQIQKPAVVARIVPPCRWGLEVISERVASMARFWRCSVVVEANNTGIALLVMLRTLGVSLYQRATGSKENPVFKPGFHTSGDTRPLIIAKLAKALAYRAADSEDPLDQGQEQEIDIWDEFIADELSYFAYLPDGSEAAEPGLHDDDVMALAIGLHCLPSGTIYRDQVREQRTTGRVLSALS